jgi:hypothetical protein
MSLGYKDAKLCQVKHCRTRHATDRKLCSKHSKQLWRARNPAMSAFRTILDRAKRKRIPFDLTFADFLEIAAATGYLENKGRGAAQLHLDRIDARKGYTVENVRVITCAENSRKGNYERRIQLGSGKWVMLHEIGIGVPQDFPTLDDDMDWDGLWATPSESIVPHPNSLLPEDHPDWEPF